MNDSYEQLIQDAKHDYHDYIIHPKEDYVGGKKVERPRWYDIGLAEDATEELNLWNYWQGVDVEDPKLMLVGQDWGCIDQESLCVANIKQIADDPHTKAQYFTGADKSRFDFDTDKNLIAIFEELTGHKLDKQRYDDLYFTNLCLGYRQDKSTGYWKQSWMSMDAKRCFPRLVKIKRPAVIVCLGQATSKTAYRALTGKTLSMPHGFNAYIDNQNGGVELFDYDNAKFIAMPHPGGMGTANRKRAKGSYWSLLDDWTFLKDVF